MKNARSLALVLAAFAQALFPMETRAEADVSFEYFEEALSPFGEWIEVGSYGLCWRPTGVSEEWAPYTDGYWAYTDAGWTWVSYEDWGGITYHYGRWVHVAGEGWVWVPEYQWGPAWVSWRSNDDYVGWAPLPPEARWEENTGFSVWVDTSYDIGPDYYRFCRTRDFGAPVLAPVCVPREENVVIIQNTLNITNISYNHHTSLVFCGGPNFGTINRHLRRPIPSLKLLREDREVRGDHGHRPPQVVRGNLLAVYAPKMKRPAELKALPIAPRRIVGADKVNRGWSRVPDLAAQEQIRGRVSKQSQGLTPQTAPARPVKAVELSSVPKIAKPDAPRPTAVVNERVRPPVRPSIPATPAQPPRPVVSSRPETTPPAVAERTRPSQERPPSVARPVMPRLPETPPARIPETAPQRRAESPQPPRLPQIAVPAQNDHAAAAERSRVQRDQQQQQAVTRQRAEAAQRASELRSGPVQQPPQIDRRAVEERGQRTEQIRQQAETANRQQAVQRANEIRNQQAQTQQATVTRQRQQSVQAPPREMRQPPQMPQMPQTRQAPPSQPPQVVQQSRPAQPPPPRQSQEKSGDDDKRKQRSR